MPIKLKTWWHHLALGALFHKSANGDISVKDAATKVSSIIDQINAYYIEYKAVFESVASDEASTTADNIIAQMLIIKTELSAVETLPDIPTKLEDYRFAKDDAENDFLHSLITTAALAFNDGNISLFEGISFFAQIGVYIKSKQ